MPHVIQVRDVPDDVHGALREAAQSRGLSLTKYLLAEMEHLARQAHAARHNAVVVRGTQAATGPAVDRERILAALHQGRQG